MIHSGDTPMIPIGNPVPGNRMNPRPEKGGRSGEDPPKGVAGGSQSDPGVSGAMGETGGSAVSEKDKDRSSVSKAPGSSVAQVDEKSLESLQNDIKRLHGVDLKFVIHESSGRWMIRVSNRETGELIREIPPEAILDIKARMAEFKGQLLNRSI